MSTYRLVGCHDGLPLVALGEARPCSPEMDVSSRMSEPQGRPEGDIMATQRYAGNHELHFWCLSYPFR